MGENKIKSGKLIYHLTKLENLDSILKSGLRSRAALLDKQKDFCDVADPDIIEKREEMELDSLVPFHFHPYSAFDVAVKNTYIEDEFIYITLKREFAKENKFKILTMHPLAKDAILLDDYDEGFEEIDWDTMKKTGCKLDYTKHVKMAECLSINKIKVKDFFQICVKDEETKKLVEQKLKDAGITKKPPHVNVQPWCKV